MTQVAELTTANTLKLPPQLAQQFHPADRFLVWCSGDTLHLKRITPPNITELVAQAPEGEPLTLDELNEIIHQLRKEPQEA